MYYLSGELSPDQGWIGFKLDTYFTFISSLCLALGAVFQLPILLTALARVGLVAPRTFAQYRGHFALASFVIAAILTPPDPVTQSMMAVPMIVLYEVGIWSARIAARKSPAPGGEAASA
jgi:sec-independent protein translocase protein TatC